MSKSAEKELKSIKQEYEDKEQERHNFVYLSSKLLKVATLSQIMIGTTQVVFQNTQASKQPSDSPIKLEIELEAAIYMIYHLIDGIQASQKKQEDHKNGSSDKGQTQGSLYEVTGTDINIIAQFINQLLLLQQSTYPVLKYSLKLLSKSSRYL